MVENSKLIYQTSHQSFSYTLLRLLFITKTSKLKKKGRGHILPLYKKEAVKEEEWEDREELFSEEKMRIPSNIVLF